MKPARLRTLILALAWTALAWRLPGTAAAQQAWTGVVSHVVDGDTIYVRENGRGRARSVRISGIDAPEICQDGGVASRLALQTQVLHREVTLLTWRQDDFGRDLASVQLGGEDMGLWMVTQGHAWSYRYRHDPGPYEAQQEAARSAGRGLFARAQAESPRDFRRRHGSCQTPP